MGYNEDQARDADGRFAASDAIITKMVKGKMTTREGTDAIKAIHPNLAKAAERLHQGHEERSKAFAKRKYTQENPFVQKNLNRSHAIALHNMLTRNETGNTRGSLTSGAKARRDRVIKADTRDD